MNQLQSLKELKTTQEKKLYINVLNKILEKMQSYNMYKSITSDRARQHKIRINKLIINGKINPLIIKWLKDNKTSDIISIDDVPKDIIIKLKYGNKYLTKSDRKILSSLRKINNKRSEKELIRDLLTNEKIIPISEKNKWLKNKKKYDIEGIDTIPSSVASYTSSLIQKKYGLLTKKKRYARLSSSKRGIFSYPKKIEEQKNRRLIRINRIIKGTSQGNITLAHEIGHSYDLFKNQFAKPNINIIKDMKKLAGKLNPPIIPFDKYDDLKNKAEFKNIPSSIKSYMTYRENPKELFADSFAFLVYNPSYVKKNNKSFYYYLIKNNPRLDNIFNKARYKIVKNIVKTIKKDKKYLFNERIKKLIIKKREEINKIKSFKKIGIIRKQRIKTLQKEINELKKQLLK